LLGACGSGPPSRPTTTGEWRNGRKDKWERRRDTRAWHWGDARGYDGVKRRASSCEFCELLCWPGANPSPAALLLWCCFFQVTGLPHFLVEDRRRGRGGLDRHTKKKDDGAVQEKKIWLVVVPGPGDVKWRDSIF
jgi:hypothetical protein